MLIGKNVSYFTELNSTNDYAKKMILNGSAQSGDVVIANSQTAGKGRLGRSWADEPGAGLYTSVMIKLSPKNTWVTLVFGLAALNTIKKATGLPLMLKWPNDIILNNKKVCGILAEGCKHLDGSDYFVIGVGINVNNKAFPEELEDKATSTFLETGESYSVTKLAKHLYHEMDYYYEKIQNGEGFASFIEQYKSNCLTLNKDVTVIQNKESVSCRVVDISEAGELIVKLDNGEKMAISSGEASVRGVLGYLQ